MLAREILSVRLPKVGGFPQARLFNPPSQNSWLGRKHHPFYFSACDNRWHPRYIYHVYVIIETIITWGTSFASNWSPITDMSWRKLRTHLWLSTSDLHGRPLSKCFSLLWFVMYFFLQNIFWKLWNRHCTNHKDGKNWYITTECWPHTLHKK